MSGFPNFSNIAGHVTTEFERRRDNPLDISKLNCWVRIASGVGEGLVLISNPNFSLFSAVGQNIASVYGSTASSGTIGTTWFGGVVTAVGDEQIGLPKPNVTSFEVDEGAGSISRKASLTITAYTLRQLEEITKYFLEPGFTVFLEWGWNTPQGVAALGGLTAQYATKTIKATTIASDRVLTQGQYESYLGFITGGSISFNGNAWEVGINLTGYPELPSYLMVTDNPKKSDDESENSDIKFNTIYLEKDLNKKRFKQMFNELPSTRRTPQVQSLLNNNVIANAVNFINFDEKVRESINESSDGFSILGLYTVRKGVSGEDIPVGTEIIGPEKFIRFGTLMQIINTFGSATGFKVGGSIIQIKINSENTPVTAFRKIFSTEKSKLIIPNPQTPEFSLKQAADKGTITPSDAVTDCSITFGGTTIQFPQNIAIEDGVANGKTIFYNEDATIVKFDKNPGEWGYLDDLYVNFDFAANILNTSKFDLKDALYQILNGMSSAVNGLWDYQIQELPKADADGLLELRIIDMNMVGIDKTDNVTELNLYGANSIFMDASFDMDIGGAMMNQIIGQRLSTDSDQSKPKGASMNQSNPTTKGRLFSTESDRILNQIQFEKNDAKVEDNTPPGAEDPDELREKNLADFFTKAGVYPQVKINAAQLQIIVGDIPSKVHFISYEDKELFNAYKNNADKVSGDNISTQFPIKFSFTVMGISGIKRGDKFVVNGIPDKYGKENGFFQVLSIKHVVEGMLWKTTVEGGFRQKRI